MNRGDRLQRRAAPGTMILLDPDLDPDPTPATKSAKRTGAPGKAVATATQEFPKDRKEKPRDVQLPSARMLARFLALAQAAVRLRGQVTVLLTTDAAIRKLNKQFRGKNKATDVLSFPAASAPGVEGLAGDLAISVTTALEQAGEQGHSLSTELKVLVLHGLLHLAGYDHEVDDGAMARKERALRAKLKLPAGLIERVEGSEPVVKSRALKGHGLSRAARALKKQTASAAEGAVSAKKLPQGPKPKISSSPRTARLKPRPFKASALPKAAAKPGDARGLKPRASVRPQSARLKSGPDTKPDKSQGFAKSAAKAKQP